MNIKEAKEEIKKAVKVYTAKTETGQYRIPAKRQRPVLLIGPPGIGKTAIMEQIARECSLGLVAYTMTHHTRQSAIGLPVLEKRNFQGREYTVTEYTMSEIIASVYDQIERGGHREGILFLDEINCVSETLMPALLQFLQYKTFGSHRLPDGWVITAAGNPLSYNRSAREFDIVTLDRVKRMEVEPDFAVWKRYALQRGLHPAVLSFLEIKPECFYVMEAGHSGFVTGRGWEDLSEMLLVMEELNLTVEDALFGQYLQDEAVAGEFAFYYRIYERWKKEIQPEKLFSGQSVCMDGSLAPLAFDERICIVWIFLQRLHSMADEYAEQKRLADSLQYFMEGISGTERQGEMLESACTEKLDQRKKGLSLRREYGLLEDGEEMRESRLEDLVRSGLKAMRLLDSAGGFWEIPKEEQRKAKERQEKLVSAVRACFDFVLRAFGKGQELVILLTGLMEHPGTGRLLKERLSDVYAQAAELLDADAREEALRRKLPEQIVF